jgi:hypothetical protein
MSEIVPAADFPGVIRGQVWQWNGVKILVTRTARDGSWADIRAKAEHGSGWSKRQPLPFPGTWELTSEYVVLS